MQYCSFASGSGKTHGNGHSIRYCRPGFNGHRKLRGGQRRSPSGEHKLAKKWGNPVSDKRHGQLHISVSASDDFGLSSVDIYMDYLKLDSYQLNGDTGFSIDIPANASEGEHVIEAFAFDVSGKNSSARVSFTVIEPHVRIFTVTVPPTSWQNQTPTNVSQIYTPKPIRITILSPTPSSSYGSSSTVNVTASVTSDYGLNRIVVYHNGIAYTAYNNLNGAKTYNFTYLVSCARINNFVSGTNEIRVFAYDTAGNVESAAVNFTANPR